MPLIQRYSNTVKGALTYTGNTLGFSDINNGGFTGIGAFLSTTIGESVVGYPTPSTLDWTKNGSTAVLSLPAGSTVAYAELIWGGSILGKFGTLPLSTLNTPITFKTPLGTNTITFSPATAFQTFTGDGQTFFTRSQDVTDLVAAAGIGTYEIDGVPATYGPEPNFAGETTSGWVLAVAYLNPSLTYSNLNIYVGNIAINRTDPPVDTTITGFSTPSVGTINTRILISGMEGNPGNTLDGVSIGPNTGSLIPLSGPNNLVNDFFSGQINNDAGLLDTTGSFGNLNQGPPPASVPGVRSGWDITNVDGSAGFTTSQTSAVLRILTQFDTYGVSTLGVQIQSGGPNINLIKAADTQVVAGSPISYSIQIENSGTLTTDNFLVTDLAPAGTTINVGSITITGATGPIINNSTTSGLNIEVGAVGIGQLVTIKYTVNTTVNTPYPVLNTAISNYNFTPVPGSTINDTIPSNQTSTNLILADLSVVKKVSPNYITTGDLAVYTVVVSNLGPSAAQSVSLIDVVPSGLIGVEYSINNGLNWSSWSSPYNIGILAAGTSITVLIRGTASSGTLGTIVNTATVSSSTPDPNLNNNVNSVNINVNNANLLAPGNFVKSADKQFANVGDEITYTINVTNTGNTIANNVVINDPIPSGTSYVAGSLSANALVTGTPAGGINVTNGIAPGATLTLSYRVHVDVIPATNPIPNTASVKYNYTVDPANQNGASGSGNSNTVTTQVNHGEILPQNAIKSVDKNPTTPGDIITYTITGANTGNVPIDVVITDVLPSGTSFISGTVIINGVSKPVGDPSLGVNVGTILASGTFTLVFKLNVLENAPSSLINGADIRYSYIVNPNLPPVINDTATNTVNTTVLKSKLTMTKSADRIGAVVGDIVRYSIIATNTGQIPLENVIVSDILAAELSYIGNLTINNVPSNQSILTGVNVGSLVVGQGVEISFDVKVIGIPTSKNINNEATSVFNYTVSGSKFNGTTVSNVETFTVYNPSFTMTKTSSKTAVKVGDTFVYTTVIKNTGDIDLENVIMKDNLPSEFKVTGITVDAVAITGDLKTGIDVGTIGVGKNKTVQITILVTGDLSGTFNNVVTGSAQVTTDPNKTPTKVNSNGTDNIGVQVFNPKLTIIKSLDKPYAVVGETVTYTVTAKNTGDMTLGNVELSPITIFDILSQSLEFIGGSVTVDGISDPLSGIVTGVDLGQLIPGQSRILTFKAKVISNSINPITNTSNGTFGFKLPGYPPEVGSSTSNVVNLVPEVANIDVAKTSDADFVVLGNTIVYTVTLKNTGTLDALNVIFKDSLPTAVQLVDGSFSVNGVVINNIDPNLGVNIGTIKKGGEAIVKYTVKVVGSNCDLKIINEASVKFNYKLPDGRSGSFESEKTTTSSVKITLGISNFKQLSVEENLTIPTEKPDIEDVGEVTSEITIIKSHIIKTSILESNEGQKLTGYKLIIHGVIEEVVEYTALDEEQSVHSAHYSIPFTTFIVLPESYCNGGKVEIIPVVEDVYYRKIDNRSLFTNATILIKATGCNC